MQVDRGFPRGSAVKKIYLQSKKRRRLRRPGFDPWVRKVPWRSAGKLTPVFLPGGLQSMGVPKSQTGLKQLSTHTCGRHETLAKNINVLFSKGNPSEIAVIQKDKRKKIVTW